ncbi:MAG TPA: hypothetical protein VIO11_06180, partial [Candidatus Methanoperedens sp.]
MDRGNSSIRLPFRLVLTVSFVVMIIGTLLVMNYLVHRNTEEEMNDFVTQLFSVIDNDVRQRLDGYMGTPFIV